MYIKWVKEENMTTYWTMGGRIGEFKETVEQKQMP